MKKKWRRVTREFPCGICGRTSWCCYHPGDERADPAWICARIQSAKEVGEAGWLHRAGETHAKIPLVRAKPDIDAPAIWQRIKARDCGPLAQLRGITEEGISAMDGVWSRQHNALAFPMRGSGGRVIGIRLRSIHGRKWCIAGSKTGLFIPTQQHDGDRVVVVEGPTDAAAAWTAGIPIVGRPHNTGGHNELLAYIKRKQWGKCTIIPDVDSGKTNEITMTGAWKLAISLRKRGVDAFVGIVDGGKDVRDAIAQCGSAYKVILETIRNSERPF